MGLGRCYIAWWGSGGIIDLAADIKKFISCAGRIGAVLLCVLIFSLRLECGNWTGDISQQFGIFGPFVD